MCHSSRDALRSTGLQHLLNHSRPSREHDRGNRRVLVFLLLVKRTSGCSRVQIQSVPRWNGPALFPLSSRASSTSELALPALASARTLYDPTYVTYNEHVHVHAESTAPRGES